MKKGEISSSTLVGLILLIAGVVLVGTIYIAFLQNTGDSREICHLSVITRATAPTAAQSGIPLNCVAEKICFTTEKNGDCYQFAGEESNRRDVELPSDLEEAREKILEESAKSMYDCWRMTGEGRLDLFGKAFQTYRSTESRCIVCSRLALAEDVKEKFPNIEEDLDLNEYLRNTTVPGSQFTYFETFAGASGINTYVGVDESEIEREEEAIKESEYIEYDENGKEVKVPGSQILNPIVRENHDEMAFVFAQRKTPKGFVEGSLIGLRDSTIILVGGGATTGLLKGAIKTIGVLPATIIGLFAIGGTGLYAGINSRSEQTASVAYCGEFESSLGEQDENRNREGCSIVRAIPYEPEYVNELCQHIEGEL